MVSMRHLVRGTEVCIWNVPQEKRFFLFSIPSKKNSGTNDASFESPFKGYLESGNY